MSIGISTNEPEVMESLLRTEVESPTKAESSKEANLGLEIAVLSLEIRRIPGGNCKLVDASSTSWTRWSSLGRDKLSTELISVLVEVSTRGFLLLPTIIEWNSMQTNIYILYTQRVREKR